jgi:hypothetical protein
MKKPRFHIHPKVRRTTAMTADVRICQLTSRTWLRKTNRADTITAKVPKRITEVPSDRVFMADICLREAILF